MVGRDAAIAVYVMADRMRGTLYIGVTSALTQRVWTHREGAIAGLTRTWPDAARATVRPKEGS